MLNKILQELKVVIDHTANKDHENRLFRIYEQLENLSNQVQAAVIKKNAEGLLPCPFCGGEPFVNKKDASLEVLCPKCLINGFVGIEKQNIIEAWNKRI